MSRVSTLMLFLAAGCAQAPTIEPLEVNPLMPASGEVRAVDHVIVIVDASGTMAGGGLLPEARAIAHALMAAMPPLEAPTKGAPEYKASLIAFGGRDRQGQPHVRFDRVRLVNQAQELRALGEPPTTPLAAVIGEAGASLSGETGRAALVIIGDGIADDADAAVSATRALVSGYESGVCIHVIQTGDSAEGRALLEQLAGLSTDRCGSVREASSVMQVSSVEDFERRIFLEKVEPPEVAAGPPPKDCNGRTVLRGVQFELDRAALLPESQPVLDLAAEQLRECSARKVLVEGHTCALGGERYNLGLSERRAAAVRDYLISHGVAPAQLETRGVGEADPAASNDTEDGRAQNRRVELIRGE